MLWLSGNWRWVEGWVFGAWWVSFMAAMVLWLHYNDPALLAERMRKPGSGGESRSDMVILFAVKVCFIAALVVSPLNVRFAWTPRLPLWSELCGGILLLGGSFFMLRAFADNTYASQLIRIQGERGQRVIDTGVYGFVRHPMYLGGSLMFVGGPLLLGSVCGLLQVWPRSAFSFCASRAKRSCWHATWRATGPIAKKCCTACCHTSGDNRVGRFSLSID
jgi:protein-S-isoprenylcysteine O-methyltransferase Ste14